MSVKDDSNILNIERQSDQIKFSKSSLNSGKSNSETFDFSPEKIENNRKKSENLHQRSESFSNKSQKSSPSKNFIRQNIEKTKVQKKPESSTNFQPINEESSQKSIQRKNLEDCKSFKDFKNSQEGEKLSLLLKERFSKTNSFSALQSQGKNENVLDLSLNSAKTSDFFDQKSKHAKKALVEKKIREEISEKSVEKDSPKRSSSRQHERSKNLDLATGFRSQQVLTIKFIKEFHTVFEENASNFSEIDINTTISILQDLNFIKNDPASPQFEEETRLVYRLWKMAQGNITVKKENLLILCLQIMNLYNLKINLNDLQIEPFKNSMGNPEINYFTPEDSLKIHKTFFSFYSNRQLCIVKKKDVEKKDEECTFKPKINENSESLAKDTYEKYGALESKEREDYFIKKKQREEEKRQQLLKEKEDIEIKQCTFKPVILKNNLRNTSQNVKNERNQESPLKKFFNKSHEKILIKNGNVDSRRVKSPGKRIKDEGILKEIQRIRNAREKKDKNTEKIINEKSKNSKEPMWTEKFKSNSKSPAPKHKNQAPVKPVNISELVLAKKNEDLVKNQEKDLTDFEKNTLAKEMYMESNNIKVNASMEEIIEKYIENDQEVLHDTKEISQIKYEKDNLLNQENVGNVNEKFFSDNQEFEELEKKIEMENLGNDFEKKHSEKAENLANFESKSEKKVISAEEVHKQKEYELEQFIKENGLASEAAEKLRQILKFSN